MTIDTSPSTWVPTDLTFGARLALVRQRMAWGNVKQAATACGLPVQSWRTWERDGVVPRHIVTVAKQIAAVTGCDYLWLLLGPDRGAASPGLVQISRYGIGERVLDRAAHTRPVRQTRPVPGIARIRPRALSHK